MRNSSGRNESANFSTNTKLAVNWLCVSSIYIIRTYKNGKAFEISWENREKSTHRPFFNLKWSAFWSNQRWKCFSFNSVWQQKSMKVFISCFCVIWSVLREDVDAKNVAYLQPKRTVCASWSTFLTKINSYDSRRRVFNADWTKMRSIWGWKMDDALISQDFLKIFQMFFHFCKF